MKHNLSFSEKIEVYERKVLNNEIKIYANNNTATPYSIKMDLVTSNMSSSSHHTQPILLRPYSNELITHLKPTSGNWNYRYTWNYKVGNHRAKQNNNYVYALPYLQNESYKVIQGYDGGLSHNSINAIDFAMPLGTRVRAMREGKVIEVKEDSKTWCPSEECADYGNFIRIEHDDKTIAQYYHLLFEGSEVEVGQYVEKGEFIGLSGNSGYSHSAHLHVEVLKPRFDTRPSGLVTKFHTQNGVEILEEGQYYIAQ